MGYLCTMAIKVETEYSLFQNIFYFAIFANYFNCAVEASLYLSLFYCAQQSIKSLRFNKNLSNWRMNIGVVALELYAVT